VLTASIIRAMIALMMQGVSTSEMSVSFYQTTRRNIPEGCHLHTRRRENLNSHTVFSASAKLKLVMQFARVREIKSTYCAEPFESSCKGILNARNEYMVCCWYRMSF
jgi:hypothetical protein